MEKMMVRVYVPQSVALVAGRSQYGSELYSPTDAELATLTPEQRSVLLKGISTGKQTVRSPLEPKGEHLYLSTADVSWFAIVSAIDMLIAEKAEVHEAKVASELDECAKDAMRPLYWDGSVRDGYDDPRLAPLLAMARELRAAKREADIQSTLARAQRECPVYADGRRQPWVSYSDEPRVAAVLSAAASAEKARQEAAKAAKEAAQAKEAAESEAAISGWVAERGSDSQRERHAAGRLDVDEVYEAHLDAALPAALLPPYERLKGADVEHERNCTWSGGIEHDAPYGFESHEYEGPLSEAQWSALKCATAAIQGAAPTADIEIREHVATCRACDATAERLSVRASVTWAGRCLSREYAL